MGEWDRRVPWRQGHILTSDAVASLRLVPDSASQSNRPLPRWRRLMPRCVSWFHAAFARSGSKAPGPEDPITHIAVVVSHDCDLAQSPDVEPMVEVITGRRVGGPNGNFTHGKNPRRLHVSATEANSTIWIELIATARRSVPKPAFCGHAPSATIAINSADLNTLQHWLAARYRRSAFPDEFDRRLDETGVADRLKKILAPLGNYILAVFFDVDEGTEREHESDHDPFTLSIELLYSTAFDPSIAEATARTAAEAITTAFRDRCFNKQTNRWRNIELLDCTPISDEALPYAESLKLKRWNADYISLRTEPIQPMITE
jgi:hypothetical protein